MTTPGRNSGGDEHGNVFGRGWGNMFIHVQRESGLAHRTLVLRPWQVQALRLVVSRWFAIVVGASVLSWAYFAVQTARVPLLTNRIAHLEQDAAKIDTLQATLEQLQRRYTQVQQMLSASARNAPAASAAAPTASAASPASIAPKEATAAPAATTETRETKPAPAATKVPAKLPAKTPAKSPSIVPDTTKELSWHS